ncbi:MerR family DNA-binding protein [Halomonas sp. AOP27-A1-41]|uniref:MerR family DNA-binding protein n=1 Tax=Halomonas sp. AOP27-A1-41 TaxID=3457707 RepID=UPI0040345FE9
MPSSLLYKPLGYGGGQPSFSGTANDYGYGILVTKHIEVAIELARLPQGSTPSAQDWSKLSKTWSERINQRIAELERLKSSLSECIGCGCLSLEHCQMVNPEDRAAGFGPGPLRWRSTDNA